MKQAKLRTVEEARAVERQGYPEAMIVNSRVATEAAAVAMEIVAMEVVVIAVVAMGVVEVGETTESVVMAAAARIMQRTEIVPAVVPAATTSPVRMELNRLRQRLLMTQMLWQVLRSYVMVQATQSAALNTLMVANLVLSIATLCAAAKKRPAVASAICSMNPS
jgi:hypothetical protein